MSAYKTAHLDEIKAEQWPYWAPIRHHFDIGSFGINAWRGTAGDEVIKRHDETQQNHEEVYLVLSGRATFTVGGDDIPAPAGTIVFISDPAAERLAVADEDGTVVLSIGAPRGAAYEVAGWDTQYRTGGG